MSDPIRIRDIAIGGAMGWAAWALLCWLVPDTPPLADAMDLWRARTDAVFAYAAMVGFVGFGAVVWPAAMSDWRKGHIVP